MSQQAEIRYFRCRKCGYTTCGSYLGQWATAFPSCRDCGLKEGRMDALDEVHREDDNGNAIQPGFENQWLSSRFGVASERIPFLSTRRPWRFSDGPIRDAVFRCRQCYWQKAGYYNGQWHTVFPLCRGPCTDGGKMDCLEWFEGSSVRIPVDVKYLSSRFGMGTEVLPHRPRVDYRRTWTSPR